MTFDDFKNREFRDVLEGMFDAMRDGSHHGGEAMWCDGRKRAVEACDRALARIGDRMARPMGADAARYVELFESREHLTQQDVESALKTYGSDHMAARRIIDHARELGFKGFDATEDERIHYAAASTSRPRRGRLRGARAIGFYRWPRATGRIGSKATRAFWATR